MVRRVVCSISISLNLTPQHDDEIEPALGEELVKKANKLLRYGEEGCATYGRNGCVGGEIKSPQRRGSRRHSRPPPFDPRARHRYAPRVIGGMG